MPPHVAIIMDGNGRWARLRGLARIEGHRAGTENIRQIIERFADYGVRYLTLFAFSTENWSRPRYEVQGLMHILSHVIKRETQHLHRNGIRLVHIGRMEGLPQKLQREVKAAIELTKDNTGLTLCVAFNYGGRAEILDAVRAMVADGVPANEIDEDRMRKYLYTVDVPDPDLIIRTAGELRISNFLIWQGAYSEFHFVSTYWPDFDIADIDEALLAYSRRRRRFGGLLPDELDYQPPQQNGHKNSH